MTFSPSSFFPNEKCGGISWKCVKEAVQNTAQQTAGVITNR